MPKYECISWEGATKQGGYGRVSYNGRLEQAHRVSYAICNGIDLSEIDGLVVRHKCDNPICINPNHLIVGTIADNMRDAVERGRHKNPVLIGSNHSRARLSEKDVLSIRASFSGKYNREMCLALADKYRVSESTISAVFYRRNWRHI